MNEQYKKYEPLFGDWKISRLIGKGSFGEVYEIERTNFGTTYKAALKIIVIPVDETELQELMSSGMSVAETKQYIKQSAQDIMSEFVLMSKLKGNTNIVSYEDHQVIEHEDKLGWDIMMKMELLEPINKYIKKNGFTKKNLIKLGIDICTALELCEKHNIVHRDIKPENIFVSPNGDFKLGDFGIARSIEKATLGLSKKGTYTYMAPEVYKGENYTTTVDIYSLGIVMYKFMNCNRIPFMPPYPIPIVYTDRENALAKRIRGEKLPIPEGVKSGKLLEIVRKACQFNSEERYQDATQMKAELMKLLETEEDTIILAPATEEPPLNNRNWSRMEEALGGEGQEEVQEEEIEKTVLIDKEELPVETPVQLPKAPTKDKRRGIIIGGLVIAVLGIVSTIYVLFSNDHTPKIEEANTQAYIEQQKGEYKESEPAEKVEPKETTTQEKAAEGINPEAVKVEENKPEEVKNEEVKAEPEQTPLEESKPVQEKPTPTPTPKPKPTPKPTATPKVGTQTSVKNPNKEEAPKQEIPVQPTPTPNAPPEIYTEFE